MARMNCEDRVLDGPTSTVFGVRGVRALIFRSPRPARPGPGPHMNYKSTPLSGPHYVGRSQYTMLSLQGTLPCGDSTYHGRDSTFAGY